MFYLAIVKDSEGKTVRTKITEDIQSAFIFLQAPYFNMTETDLEQELKKDDEFDEYIEHISKEIEEYIGWTATDSITKDTITIISLTASSEMIKEVLENEITNVMKSDSEDTEDKE